MMLTLGDIVQRLGFELHGDPTLSIVGVCGISDDLPDRLSFVARAKHTPAARSSRIPAFIVRPNELIADKSCIVHAEPEYACALVAALFVPSQYSQETPLHPTAVVDPSATLGAGVRIGPYVVIGRDVKLGARSVIHPGAVLMDRVVVGADCVIHAHVTVREDCVLGDRVVVQPGAAIGGDGFGFVLHEGRHHKIPQIGNVVIEDDVEIGANATIDRGRFTATRVGRGTKIDNLVMVGHNVQIGEDCLLVSQTGISGSTVIGDRVTMGGQVGVAGHLRIHSDVTALARAGIVKNVLRPGVYAGFPLRPFAQWKKTIAWLHAQAKRATAAAEDADSE